jgi:hypothetical protein
MAGSAGDVPTVADGHRDDRDWDGLVEDGLVEDGLVEDDRAGDDYFRRQG